MSEFLKNLSDALAGKVFIENPLMEFGRNGDMIGGHDGVKLSSLKQFVVTPYGATENPSIISEYHSNIIKDFRIDIIQELVNFISTFSKKIRFVPLTIPYGVEVARIERHNHIVGRYIEAYIPQTDEVGKRWDFLIQKLD